MNRIVRYVFCSVALTASSQIWAGVNCTGPSKSGDRWSYICSEDGSASADLSCTYNFSLQLEGGGSVTASSTNTIARKAKNVVMWSEERYNGKKITSASYVGGSCSTK